MEQFASDEGRIGDDCRAQSSGQLEEQRNRGESDAISSGHDQVEVGQDGMPAHERLEGKSAKVQGMIIVEGIQWKRRRAGVQLESLWENRVYVGIRATTKEFNVGGQSRYSPEKERWI